MVLEIMFTCSILPIWAGQSSRHCSLATCCRLRRWALKVPFSNTLAAVSPMIASPSRLMRLAGGVAVEACFERQLAILVHHQL